MEFQLDINIKRKFIIEVKQLTEEQQKWLVQKFKESLKKEQNETYRYNSRVN